MSVMVSVVINQSWLQYPIAAKVRSLRIKNVRYHIRRVINVDKKELVKRLILECNTGDAEIDHCKADNLLLEYINDYDVSEEFNNIEKWYA